MMKKKRTILSMDGMRGQNINKGTVIVQRSIDVFDVLNLNYLKC